MPHLLAARYEKLIKSGQIESDSAQAELVACFIELDKALQKRQNISKNRIFGRFFSNNAQKAIKGLYIWGSVGRGKTMLMDLFFETSAITQKKRIHFHAFMADVHERIYNYRSGLKQNNQKQADPIQAVGDQLSHRLKLLCFDEFHVTDIADAMILGRLFERLFANGVTVVATSNTPPPALYPNGLNRQLFLPFIALLKRHMDIIELAARADFRLEKLKTAQTYFTPLSLEADEALDQIWADLTGSREPGQTYTIPLKGRELIVPQARKGVARFCFEELCNRPLGAIDYLALARHFHTLILDHIPKLSRQNANAARRFMHLIDTLYDHQANLVASAEATPERLCQPSLADDLPGFARAASRLIEMQSREYLAKAHKPS